MGRTEEIKRLRGRANELRCYADRLEEQGRSAEFIATTRKQARELDAQADQVLSDLRMTIVMEGFGCDMDPRQ